jgi:tetratricopeptide (TPR) repeat protein
MTRKHDTTVVGASILVGVATLLMVAVGGTAIGSATDQLPDAAPAEHARDSMPRESDDRSDPTTGVRDANDRALEGLEELQQARETADPAHYARAEAAFEDALASEPENVAALIGKGTLALARHRFTDALALGNRVMRLDPTQSRALGIIGDAQVELGRYDDAIATVQRMVDTRPDLASYSRVSYLRELHGDLAGAIEAMKLAVEAGGPSLENTEYVRVQLGYLYLARGDLAAAETTFGVALRHLPHYVHAAAGLARVRAAQDRLPRAIALFEDAAGRTPLPEFVIALGEAYEASGRTDEADDQYAVVEAMVALQKANGVEVDLDLAAFVADHGDPERAVELARAAYDRAPSIRAAAVLAWALFAAGEVDEAAAFADEALRTGWRDVKVLVHAGLIAEAVGQGRVARDRLELAVELNPTLALVYAPDAAAALDVIGAGD